MLQKYHFKKNQIEWQTVSTLKTDSEASVSGATSCSSVFPESTEDSWISPHTLTTTLCLCVSFLLHHSSPDCPQHLTNDTYLQLTVMDWEE